MSFKQNFTLHLLVIVIALSAAIAASFGIFWQSGSGSFEFMSVHGNSILLSGKGLYKNMSTDVAIQGIAQDYITLFVAIPFLLWSLWLTRHNSLRSMILLAGTLGYFMVTYFFYLSMGTYNEMYLVYTVLAGCTFYAFYISIKRMDSSTVLSLLKDHRPAFAGWVLMVNSILVALLWLNIVIPPLIDGSIYPDSLQHYTTLIVQGYDLAILLPASFISGYLFVKRKVEGLRFAPVYLVFLSLLMLALIAKIIGMRLTGVETGPPTVIIPIIWLVTVGATIGTLKKIKQ